MLMVYVLFAAALLSLGLEVKNSADFYVKSNTSRFLEIKKFVETPEPIWTYNSTSEISFRCKVDVMSVCKETFILFNRTYYINKQNLTQALKGWFRQDRKDQMFVAVLGIFPTTAEQLVYVSPNNSCAVIEVWLPFPSTKPWYDLRIKNSSVITDPSQDCSAYFNKTAGAGKKLYIPDCQAILQPATVTRREPV